MNARRATTAALITMDLDVSDVSDPLVKRIEMVFATVCERLENVTVPLLAVAVRIPCNVPVPPSRAAAHLCLAAWESGHRGSAASGASLHSSTHSAAHLRLPVRLHDFAERLEVHKWIVARETQRRFFLHAAHLARCAVHFAHAAAAGRSGVSSRQGHE